MDTVTFYEWYEITTDARGRDRKRRLTWRMTEEGAAAYAANGRRIEMVPNSGERRHVGGYVGWGSALRT